MACLYSVQITSKYNKNFTSLNENDLPSYNCFFFNDTTITQIIKSITSHSINHYISQSISIVSKSKYYLTI